ncbi:hypothetical protein BK712_06760 [Bacillus thuringiensis serovar seoulensis]|nr:hypothetical protein BK712_06760 [Bacillus thuringiensis serovar seoulensis]
MAQVNAKHGRDPGLSFYTHISDQYAPFYVQVISSSEEAPHIIDVLLYHETDLEIEERYKDKNRMNTHGKKEGHLYANKLFRFPIRTTFKRTV